MDGQRDVAIKVLRPELAAVIGAAHRRLSSAEPAQPAPEGSRERRIADLGDGFAVRRALPHGKRQMVGPFIFFDHFGPAVFTSGKGLDVRQGHVSFSSEFAGQCTLAENGIEDVLPWLGMAQPGMYSMELSLLVLEAGSHLPEALFEKAATATFASIGSGARIKAGIKGQHRQALTSFFTPEKSFLFVNDREHPYESDRDFYLWLRGKQVGGNRFAR